MQYRKEIDGLRAIAILPVILFHADVWGISGGYIGVDIFFVISGFLITSIILEEKRKNTFSIINFYERRARRILPALTLVLIFTTIAAYLLMPANLLKLYSQSLISVAASLSNVFFYTSSGYFSTASDEMPLLHTWSLAVEEQYYLFFPVLIIALWSFGKKWLLSSILFIATLSLITTHVLLYNNEINANFYLIFSRAWELLLGSAIAFIPLKDLHTKQWKKELISTSGMIMIIYSILYFNEQTPFPSVYTLIPIVGTCLIILYADSTSLIGRFLSLKILVFTGLISYSLYLWHQPIFAFLRMKSLGEPSTNVFMAAIVCTFILAYFSYKYVETPFRNKKAFSRAAIFKYSSATIVIFLSIGLVGHLNMGFKERFDVADYRSTMKHSPMRKQCHTKSQDYLKPSDACKYFGEKITWASFGDSHTVEPAYALAKRLEVDNIGLVHLSFSGCPPSLLFEVKRAGCTKWFNESLNYIENDPNIKNVLLGYRYAGFLYGDHLDTYPNIPNINPNDLFTESFNQSTPEQLRELYWKSLETLITRLQKADKNIYILYPIPELPVNIHKAVVPFSAIGNSTMVNLDRATSTEYFYKRNKAIISKLDALPYGKNLHAIKPFDIICDEKYCPAVKNNKALYYDDDHLSISGAESIVENINLEKQIRADEIVFAAQD